MGYRKRTERQPKALEKGYRMKIVLKKPTTRKTVTTITRRHFRMDRMTIFALLVVCATFLVYTGKMKAGDAITPLFLAGLFLL